MSVQLTLISGGLNTNDQLSIIAFRYIGFYTIIWYFAKSLESIKAVKIYQLMNLKTNLKEDFYVPYVSVVKLD